MARRHQHQRFREALDEAWRERSHGTEITTCKFELRARSGLSFDELDAELEQLPLTSITHSRHRDWFSFEGRWIKIEGAWVRVRALV